MSDFHYRKAKKGEITCKQCIHSLQRPSGRTECGINGYMPFMAVAKGNTCNWGKVVESSRRNIW